MPSIFSSMSISGAVPGWETQAIAIENSNKQNKIVQWKIMKREIVVLLQIH